MIKCPKCSAELTDTDVFCFTCGHKIEQTTLPDQSSEGSSVLMPCPKCQTIPASNEDIFCAECGTRLVQETVNIDPDMNNIHGNESIQIQTEPDEFPKIVEEPVIVKDDQPIQQTEIKTEPQKPAQQEVIKKPIVQQPVQPVVPVTTQSVAGKKRKAGKTIFVVLLVLFLIAVIGGGVLGFLIYNGNVSRKVASQYIPSSFLDILPSATGTNATATRYFVIYSFGQFDKQPAQKGKKTEKEKKAVISDVFTNIDTGSETNDGAEVAFRNAGNNQITKFSRFSNYFVNSFATNLEAMKERENIIKDLKSKGYKTEFVRVVK